MIWAQVTWWVVTSLISYMLRPGPPPGPKAATLADVKAPVAVIGEPIPVLFGTRDISSPNVVWYGHLKSAAIRKSGGKK